MKNSGIAIMVKTPGFSPIKARLSASIGPLKSLQFYQLMLQVIEELMKELMAKDAELSCYWAVAEKEAMYTSYWPWIPCLSQGEGGVGMRLQTVYGQLLERHKVGVILNADIPFLSAAVLQRAMREISLGQKEFAVGPTIRGDFYLFAGSQLLPQAFWSGIPYQCNQTVEQLLIHLNSYGEYSILPTLTDVSEGEDLKASLDTFDTNPTPLLPAQQKMLEWIKQTHADFKGKLSGS